MNLIFTHGKTILLICLISTGIGYFIHPILGVLGILFTAFSIYFFRNPERRAENDDPRALISPADGKVVDIQQSIDGQFEGYDQKISYL
jgi:phosphatidylserine decarboxylase